MAAVRHTWMFRAAALVFLFFGGVWLWRFGLTDYQPERRLYGLIAGGAAVLIGIFLWRRSRPAIGLSAVASVIISLSAAAFAPSAHGPAILALAALALLGAVYAVLAARVLLDRRNWPPR
jgi:peptidoglycan/LPS O-acetylase OafA/YrhL